MVTPTSVRSSLKQSAPRFAGALSVETESPRAIREAIAELKAGLGGATPDLVLAFATHHHGPALEGLGPALARASGARVVAGCTAESVIGGAREVEGRPGIALWAAHPAAAQRDTARVRVGRGDGATQWSRRQALHDCNSGNRTQFAG